MPVPWATIEADPEFQALDADGQYDIASRWQEKMKAQLPVEEHDPFLEASNNRLSKYFAPKAIQAAQLSQSLLGGVTSPLGAATALASGELQVEQPKPLELAPAIPSIDQTMPPTVETPAGLGPELAPIGGAGTVGELLTSAKEAVSTPVWQAFGVEKIPASAMLPGGQVVDLIFNSLGESKAAQVIQGLHKVGTNQIENLTNFMGSPLGIATMGLGSLGATAQRIASLAFAADMASSQPALWERFQKATTLREKTETLGDAVAGGLLTLTALKHGLTKIEKTAPAAPAEPPPLPSPTPLTDAAIGETSTQPKPQQETPNATQTQRIGQSIRPEPQGGTQGGQEKVASLGDRLQRPAAGETAPEVVQTKETAPVVQPGEAQAREPILYKTATESEQDIRDFADRVSPKTFGINPNLPLELSMSHTSGSGGQETIIGLKGATNAQAKATILHEAGHRLAEEGTAPELVDVGERIAEELRAIKWSVDNAEKFGLTKADVLGIVKSKPVLDAWEKIYEGTALPVPEPAAEGQAKGVTQTQELTDRLAVVQRRLAGKIPKSERPMWEAEQRNILQELYALDKLPEGYSVDERGNVKIPEKPTTQVVTPTQPPLKEVTPNVQTTKLIGISTLDRGQAELRGETKQPQVKTPISVEASAKEIREPEWKAVPSVTGGGKDFFYIKDTSQGRRWVSWDRARRKWTVTGEQEPPRGQSPLYGVFDTEKAAKDFVDSGKTETSERTATNVQEEVQGQAQVAPELMTPENTPRESYMRGIEGMSEPIVLNRRKLAAKYGIEWKSGAFPNEELLTPDEYYAANAQPKTPYNRAGLKREASDENHADIVRSAIEEKVPVSATAVDAYGITLPEGYTLEGDRYVYKSQPSPPAAVPPAAPEAPRPAEAAAAGAPKAPAAVPPAEAPKEPWQMTRKEWDNEIQAAIQDFSRNVTRGANRLEQLTMDIADGEGSAPDKSATHKDVLEKALREGKPVPPEVLADYPDLKAAAEAPKPASESLRDLWSGLTRTPAVKQAISNIESYGWSFIADMTPESAKAEISKIRDRWNAIKEHVKRVAEGKEEPTEEEIKAWRYWEGRQGKQMTANEWAQTYGMRDVDDALGKTDFTEKGVDFLIKKTSKNKKQPKEQAPEAPKPAAKVPKALVTIAKSATLNKTLPEELRQYSDAERADIAKAIGTTETEPEALSNALIERYAVNKTETPSPFPKGEVGTEARSDEIDQLVKSEGGIGSEGPGAASAAEKLASYEERKFGKRFVEDKRIAQEIREGTGNRYYEPIPNKVTAEESANLVNQRGIAKSIEDIKDEANGLQPHIRNTMGQVVILRLNEAYRNLKDKAPAEAETILNQATDLAEWQMDYGTRLGQGVQAFAMWARLTPEGKLLAFKRMVKKARDRHRTESQGEVEEIIEGVQAGQAKNAVTRAATKTAETKGIWERYKDQIAGNLAKRLDEASSQSPALQEFSRRLQANIADLVPKPESAKRVPLTPAEAFREVVTNWDKYKEAWERTKEEVSKSLSQADEMVMQSVEAAMGDLRSAADTRSFAKLLRETLKKHDTEITGLIDKGEIADATNRTITYIEDAIGFKLDSTQRAGIEKSITGQLDQISIKRAKAAAERQRKAIEGEANKIAKVLSDTPTFDKTAKNEALALIRAHLKEPQADFVEKIKAFGADEKTANSLDRMAAENRRRIELIRELETLGRPEKEAVSIAESMAKDLSDVPTWNDKMPSEVKALIREHSTTGVEDFAVKMKALGITDRTIELVDRIAAENRRRVVAVDRARRVEQLRKQYTRPVAKKIPKELWQRLVELGDANLLNEQSFYDVVSQKLGLPNYDKPTVAKLTELANAVRDAAEGVPRDKAIFELNRFIAHQKGFSATDLPIGIYYGNILSGYNTHIVNSLDTFLNVVSEVNGLAATNPRAASQIYGGLFRGLSEGRLDALNALTEGRMVTDGKWMEAPRLMEAARFGEKGGVPILEGTQTGRLTKRLAESKPATVLNAWKYVSRALGASDAIMFRGAKEARAALLAFRMAEAEGLKGEAVDARVREILANDKMQDFLDQAKREGLSGREAETHARILREMARDKDLSSDSADFAGEATYNHKPHGMLGYFSEMLGKASESYPVLKLFVPFTRIVANVTNRGLNWTPYGYKRAWKGYSKGEPLTPEQRQQMLFRATAGTAGLVGLGTLHALGVITINGAGPSDREKRRQLKETGWRPYSIRIGDTYYTYTYTPVGLGLSVLGNWFDAVKYHELEQKDAATRAGYTITQLGSTVFSQSFLSGLSKLFQMVSDRSSDSIQAFKQTVSSTAGAMTTPTLFRDIQRLFDPKIYQSNTLMEDLIKNTPFAFLKLKPTLNAFGEPVTPYRNRFIGRISSDPAWKLVSDLGVRVPVPGKNTELKKDVQFTPEQYYRLQENSGKRMRQWFLGQGATLGGLTSDQAQDVVDRTASAIFSQEANRIRSGQ